MVSSELDSFHRGYRGRGKGKRSRKGMLDGHRRVPVVWSAGSGEQLILGEGKVFPVAPS